MNTFSEIKEHFFVCNNSYFRKLELFYKLKTEFFEKYGVLEGYILQTFDKYWYNDFDETIQEIKSTHNHILKEYNFWGVIVHIPTNEYKYTRWSYEPIVRKSENYSKYKELCKKTIEGRKEKKYNAEAFESLKFLIRWYREKEKIIIPLFKN